MLWFPPLEVLDVQVHESSATIVTPHGWVSLSLDADCCSRSYFDDAACESLLALKGKLLVEMDDVEGRREEWPSSGMCVRWHALLVKTTESSETLMWRNDSNGYYDGDLTVEFLPIGGAQ